MNTLVAKEIRQMRPALVAALFLAVVPVWLYPGTWTIDEISPGIDMLFCLGTLFLALTTFGREFGMGTYPLLLALPLSRRRIWWAKTGILACAVVAVFFAGCLSLTAWHSINFTRGSWLEYAIPAYRHFILHLVLALLVIVVSGLWTTLFLRQMLAAFWFAMVVPLALLMLASWGGENIVVGEVVMGIYAVAGFFLAQRLFYRAQEVAWTGGEVNLPALRSAGAARTAADRSYHPLAALIGKELQLYKIPLAGMAAMFLLHLGAILLRRTLLRSDPDSHFAAVLSTFGGLWFLLPLVIGGISISEERRMGTMEGHLCLPVSRRVQFFIKLFFSLLISGLLCGSLLWLAEYIAATLHAGGGLLGTLNPSDTFGWRRVALEFALLSFVVFYASTLSRSLLQHIAVTLGIVLAFFVIENVAWAVGWRRSWIWQAGLYDLITWPTMFLTAFFLAYANFRRLSEARRLWLRNLGSFACLLILMPVLVAAIYYRTWEYLTPLEPAHGPAKLSLASPPRLEFDWRTVSVFMPDGRVWSRRIAYKAARQIKPFGENMPVPLGASRWIMTATDDFDGGSNWVALAHNARESVAIRADGTLWLSAKPQRVFNYDEEGRLLQVNAHESLPMARFGGEADWKDVARVGGNTVMLLKRDGTIWLWGNEHTKDFPGLATMQPVRAGTDSDWARFLWTAMGAFVWKNDGRAWEMIYPRNEHSDLQTKLTPDFALLRQKSFDKMKMRRIAWSEYYYLTVCEDGTLWMWHQPDRFHNNGDVFEFPWEQLGTETDWVSVTADGNKLVALKNDGTLWKWSTVREMFSVSSPFRNPPERLGTHSDWVALGSYDCALAADGSLWFWNDSFESSVWLTPQWKPYMLGNVFSQK